jgi:hypothetical protein
MMTRKEAESQGLVVDDTCYPWIAYKGARFNPIELHKCLTDRETGLVEATEGLLAACQHHGIKTGTMLNAQHKIYEARPVSAFGRKP